MAPTSTEQQYGPTSGVVTGWVGMAVWVVASVWILTDPVDVVAVRWLAGLAALAVLTWAMMLRPRIIVRLPDSVELRNPFSSWLVPLASVEVVAVRAITRIGAAGTHYDAVAVGRRIRKMVRPSDPPAASASGSKRIDFRTPEGLADLMTEQILAAADEARRTGQQAGPGVRTWATRELAALGACLMTLAVALLL